MMFNNQIYGLTKGQYSPTSEVGKITKSSPFGSLDHPFNPVSVALGAEATFVARTHDMDRKHMMEMFRRAHEHEGARVRRDLPELQRVQRRRVRGDHRQGRARRHAHRAARTVSRSASAPTGERGVMLNEFGECEIVEVADVGEDKLLVHDEHRDRPGARVRARRASRRQPTMPTPIGVFRDVDRPTYEAEVQRQLVAAVERQGPGDLAALIGSGATWEVN